MSRTAHSTTIEELAPSAVTTDPEVNTRPIDKSWVARKLREGFDVKRLGVPTVSARADGSRIWVDGQNRGALCLAAQRADIKISMKVFHGLAVAEEAELFLGLNDNRRVQPIYKFMAEVTAGRKEALAITEIVEKFGWKVSDGSSNKAIHAVAALTSLYRATGDRPGHLLREVLTIATDAWGQTPEAVNANILLGLGATLMDCPEIDRRVMTKKLAAHSGGPSNLLGKGRGLKEAMNCKVSQGVDQIIRSIYNSGRRGSRLPTWAVPASRNGSVQESLLT
ncbi:hypothetical protein GCM10010326_71960 [Streptomyces xanthochromogenes]|uniref:ParB/Sulfiredoxin domain-containing protein n=2 Tax=Streptomyces xanthochromogenes TaxID=67384 RepID=A0ABQ3AT52_9ACTN|nr:hypothetical protein GCM10010326_71960 [Streptomyces xanthochromogenes]